MPDIQVFGRDDSPDDARRAPVLPRTAVVVHYVDLRKRPIAPGELQRFTERLGPRLCSTTTSRPYRDGGLGYLSLDDAGIVARLLADPRLLRLPLVRHGNEVTVGRPRRPGPPGSGRRARPERRPRDDDADDDQDGPDDGPA